MMILSTLNLVTGLVTLLGVVLLCLKSRKSRLLGIILITLTLLSTLARCSFRLDSPALYTDLSIAGHTSYQHLIIHDHKIVDGDTFEAVTYYASDQIIKNPDFHPIYLRDLENDYYLVVFSKDMTKRLPYQRFTQRDYELNKRHTDYLAIISKDTGQIVRPRVYEYIGFTFDLDQVVVTENMISIPVFKKYENVYGRYMTLFIATSPDDRFHLFDHTYAFATGQKHITKFAAVDGFILAAYSDLTLSYDFYIIDVHFAFSHNTYQPYTKRFHLTGPKPWILDGFTYVAQGYFTVFEEHIYVLGDDLKLYFISISSRSLVYVKDLDTLENWIEHLE